MAKPKKKIIVVTTTRADWGILSPLARALASEPSVSLTVAAGNMHLLERYGHTIDEIISEGFTDIVRLDVPALEHLDESSLSRSAISCATQYSLARLLEREKTDAVIMLGDRFEVLGAATAALVAGVPIVHLHGGEVSLGAIDDSVRHAISKMATLHLVATPLSAKRLVAMGEEPDRIVVTGAIGVENALSIPVMDRQELIDSLDGFDVDPNRTLLVTFHPVTRHPDGIPTDIQLDNLLQALSVVDRCNAIITFPNNDLGSEIIIRRLETFACEHSDRIRLVKSLGRRRYLSAMHHVRAVVGNTSSGILEAPSTPAVTIDIGPRQDGRERSPRVIHVEDSAEAIEAAIRKLIDSPRPATVATENPYYKPGSVNTAVDAILNLLPTLNPAKRLPL